MSIVQFLRILLARWRIILLGFVGCFAVATLVVMSLPKRYEASARVILDPKPDPVTGLAQASSAMRGYASTQMQLVTDYRVTGQVVDRLGLANNADYVAAYQRANAGGGTDLRRYIADNLATGMKAQLVEGSNILELTYTGTDPELAKRVVDILRDAYIAESLRLRTEGSARTADWFRDQATRAQQQLLVAETAKTDFMRKTGIVMNGDVDSETAKLQQMESTVAQARTAAGAGEANFAAKLANDPVVDQLRLQAAAAAQAVTDAGERLGPQHPAYKAAVSRQRLLSAQLARAESSSRAGVSGASGAMRGNAAQAERDYEGQKSRVLANKENIDKLGALQREVDLRRGIYQNAAARTAQLRMQADVNETGLTILGEPFSSGAPVWPKIPLVVGLGALFGLGLGMAAALIIEFLARRVRGLEDLEYATNAPVMAVVRSGHRSALREWVARRLGRRRDAELDDPALLAAE